MCYIVQELCESRGGRPGLSVVTRLLVSVDVKLYFGIGLSLSLIRQVTSEDIKQHYLPTFYVFGCCFGTLAVILLFQIWVCFVCVFQGNLCFVLCVFQGNLRFVLCFPRKLTFCFVCVFQGNLCVTTREPYSHGWEGVSFFSTLRLS